MKNSIRKISIILVVCIATIICCFALFAEAEPTPYETAKAVAQDYLENVYNKGTTGIDYDALTVTEEFEGLTSPYYISVGEVDSADSVTIGSSTYTSTNGFYLSIGKSAYIAGTFYIVENGELKIAFPALLFELANGGSIIADGETIYTVENQLSGTRDVTSVYSGSKVATVTEVGENEYIIAQTKNTNAYNTIVGFGIEGITSADKALITRKVTTYADGRVGVNYGLSDNDTGASYFGASGIYGIAYYPFYNNSSNVINAEAQDGANCEYTVYTIDANDSSAKTTDIMLHYSIEDKSGAEAYMIMNGEKHYFGSLETAISKIQNSDNKMVVSLKDEDPSELLETGYIAVKDESTNLWNIYVGLTNSVEDDNEDVSTATAITVENEEAGVTNYVIYTSLEDDNGVTNANVSIPETIIDVDNEGNNATITDDISEISDLVNIKSVLANAVAEIISGDTDSNGNSGNDIDINNITTVKLSLQKTEAEANSTDANLAAYAAAGVPAFEVHPVLTVSDGTNNYEYEVKNSEVKSAIEFSLDFGIEYANKKIALNHVYDGATDYLGVYTADANGVVHGITLNHFSYITATARYSDTYTAYVTDVPSDLTDTTIANLHPGDTFSMSVIVTDGDFDGIDMTLTFNNSNFVLSGITLGDDIVAVYDAISTANTNGAFKLYTTTTEAIEDGSTIVTLTFTVKDIATTTVGTYPFTLTKAKISGGDMLSGDAISATVQGDSVALNKTYNVQLSTDTTGLVVGTADTLTISGNSTASYGTAYTATIGGYDTAKYVYNPTITIGGTAYIGYTVNNSGVITIPGTDIIDDIAINVSVTPRSGHEFTYNAISGLDVADQTNMYLSGNATGTYGTDLAVTINGYDTNKYTYAVTYTVNGGSPIDAVVSGGVATIPGTSITGNVVVSATATGVSHNVTIDGVTTTAATYATDYDCVINNYEPDVYEYTITYNIGGTQYTVAQADITYNSTASTATFTIDGTRIVSDVEVTVTYTLDVDVVVKDDYISNWYLVLVTGNATSYKLDNHEMYDVSAQYGANTFGYLVSSNVYGIDFDATAAKALVTRGTAVAGVINNTYDVNVSGTTDYNDLLITYRGYRVAIRVSEIAPYDAYVNTYMPYYLRANVNAKTTVGNETVYNYKVDTNDVIAVYDNYNN